MDDSYDEFGNYIGPEVEDEDLEEEEEVEDDKEVRFQPTIAQRSAFHLSIFFFFSLGPLRPCRK